MYFNNRIECIPRLSFYTQFEYVKYKQYTLYSVNSTLYITYVVRMPVVDRTNKSIILNYPLHYFITRTTRYHIVWTNSLRPQGMELRTFTRAYSLIQESYAETPIRWWRRKTTRLVTIATVYYSTCGVVGKKIEWRKI